MNARRPHIKNGLGYKMGNKHNSRVNNNGQEFIKFTKGNSHQVKTTKQLTMFLILMLLFLTCLIMLSMHLMFSLKKHGKVIALYVMSHHKRHKTCVWVPKVLLSNVKGPKQVCVPKNKY
jgi:hypothetical protein